MNDNQRRQIEEARKESEEKTFNVCADGTKHGEKEYGVAANQVNDE